MNEKLVKLISQRLFLGRGTIFTGSAMWTGSGPYVGWTGSDINSFKAIKKQSLYNVHIIGCNKHERLHWAVKFAYYPKKKLNMQIAKHTKT
jgi:hypothetical protein